jgi:hypothetical protein
MSSEDSPELREALTKAWQAVTTRLLDSGHPPAAVVETMFTAAAERFAELHGSTAAANYLHLLADQMLMSEKKRVDTLIRG